MKELRQIKNIRGIVTRLLVSFFLLFSAFFVKQYIVRYQMNQEENTSYVINIAGRQRMLSQKITKDLAFMHQGDPNYKQDLKFSLEQFQRSQEQLIELGSEDRIIWRQDDLILHLYEDLDPNYQSLIELSESYLTEWKKSESNQDQLDSYLLDIQETENIFLTKMDQIVFTYQEEAQKALTFIQRTNLFLSILIIALMFFVFMMVFLPLMNHSMQSYFQMRSMRRDLFRILENMKGILFLVNREGEIIFQNQGATILLKDKNKEIMGNISERVDWINFDILNYIEQIEVNEESEEDIEVLVEDSEGNILPLSLSLVSGYYNEEEVVILTLFDLTKQKNAEEILKKLAIRDELTGLYNRHVLENISEKEFTRADRYQIPLSVTLLDLDDFKQVNDVYGHPIGDDVLRLTAKIIKSNVRASDYALRIGGEEMLIFLPNTDVEEAKSVAEKLRLKLESASHPKVGQVTASFGLVERHYGEDYLELYKRVDDALYQAKQKGKNRVEVL